MAEPDQDGNTRDTFRAQSKWFSLDIRGRDITRMVGIVGIVLVLAIAGWVVRAILASQAESEASDIARAVRERMPQSRAEHEAILGELRVHSYILSECLQVPPRDCPRLRRPTELLERVEPERPTPPR